MYNFISSLHLFLLDYGQTLDLSGFMIEQYLFENSTTVLRSSLINSSAYSLPTQNLSENNHSKI